MITFYSSINFIAAAIMFAFSVFLYQGSSEKNIRAYTFYTASTACWGLGIALYVYFSWEQYTLMLYALRYAYATGIPTAAAFYYFSRLQRDPNGSHKLMARILQILCIVQLGAYVFTSSLVTAIAYGHNYYERIIQYDLLGFTIFNLTFALLVGAAFTNLWQAWHLSPDPARRAQSKLLFWAGVMAWWPPILMCVLLFLVGNFSYYWVAPIVTSLWVVFTAYSIFRNNLFKVRIIVPALLITILLAILFVNIFIPNFGDLFFVPK